MVSGLSLTLTVTSIGFEEVKFLTFQVRSVVLLMLDKVCVMVSCLGSANRWHTFILGFRPASWSNVALLTTNMALGILETAVQCFMASFPASRTGLLWSQTLWLSTANFLMVGSVALNARELQSAASIL